MNFMRVLSTLGLNPWVFYLDLRETRAYEDGRCFNSLFEGATMPNYCTNRLTLQGPAEDVAAFRELMVVEREENGEKVEMFDFERIIPMPAVLSGIGEGTIPTHFFHILKRDAEMQRAWEWMNTFRSGCLGSFAEGILLEDEQLEALLGAYDQEDLAAAKAMVVAERETGYTSWYKWSIDKWGTKWNSMHCRVESEEPFQIRFDTAWSAPVPVLQALSERYPNLHIHCASFDEGWGFAAEGWFNPPEDGSPYDEVEPDAAVYERVYGHPPERDEDEDEVAETEAASEDQGPADPDKPIWAM